MNNWRTIMDKRDALEKDFPEIFDENHVVKEPEQINTEPSIVSTDQPFEAVFGFKIKVYPNGTIYFDKPFPIGKTKALQSKKKKTIGKKIKFETEKKDTKEVSLFD